MIPNTWSIVTVGVSRSVKLHIAAAPRRISEAEDSVEVARRIMDCNATRAKALQMMLPAMVA
jgi:hypothetical protein